VHGQGDVAQVEVLDQSLEAGLVGGERVAPVVGALGEPHAHVVQGDDAVAAPHAHEDLAPLEGPGRVAVHAQDHGSVAGPLVHEVQEGPVEFEEARGERPQLTEAAAEDAGVVQGVLEGGLGTDAGDLVALLADEFKGHVEDPRLPRDPRA
jgi:hypothetical protein